MRAILGIAALGAVLLALLVSPQITQRLDDHNVYQRQVEAYKLDQQALQLEQARATLPARVASDYALGALLIVGGLAILVIAIDGYAQRRRPLTRFGGYPVSRELVSAGDPALIALLSDAIRAAGVAAIEQARNPGQPHTYSPHLIIRGSDVAGMLPDGGRPAALASVPTFGELLNGGAIGPDVDGRRQPLILGYGDDGPITGDWRSLYSSGLGGLQGSGKTWGAVFLLAQSALNGAQLVICDPHAADDESLAARVSPLAPAFVCDIAEDDRAILAALQLADDTLQRRKRGDKDRRPLIVAIDEWSSLRRGRLAEVLPALVEDFSTEGRKLNCHVMLMGQRWDKVSVGDFRNTLASSYVFRMRADEARMMTGLRAALLPPDTLQLEPGRAYLLDTRGQIGRVAIPQMTPADLVHVGARLGSEAPINQGSGDRSFGFRAAVARAVGTHTEPTRNPAEPSPEAAPLTSAEKARILTLFYNEGLDPPEIVRRIWPDLSKGRATQERSRQVWAVIRQARGVALAGQT